MKFLKIESLFVLALSLLICQSPWTGQFSYEFSFFLSVGLFAILLPSSLFRFHRKNFTVNQKLQWIGSYGSLLLIPLITVFVFALKYGVCGFLSGCEWYVLLPCVTTVFAVCSSLWATSNHKAGWRLWFFAFFPAILFSILTILDLWIDPQISFYHPVLGYFPGPVYDEWIPKFASLWTYRIWVLCFSFWIAFFGSFSTKTWKRGGILLIVFLFREPLGWHYSHHYIQKGLGGFIETQYSKIYYPKSMLILSSEFGQKIDATILNLSQNLQLEPPTEKIRIYVYPNPYLKKKWIGTQYTLIGNPIQKSLHLLSMKVDPITIHELSHVVAAPMGIPIFHISPKIGLLEGLATAIQKTEMGINVHEWAKTMLLNNDLPDIEKSLGAFSFWKENPTKVYYACGSFVDFLIQTEGIEKFKQVYRGKSFQNVYQKPTSNLIRDWHLFLEQVNVTDEKQKNARVFLEEKPFYKKKCVHEVAEFLVNYNICGKKEQCRPYLENACKLDLENLRLQDKCSQQASPKL